MRAKLAKRREHVSWGRFALGLSALALVVLWMKHSRLAADAVERGLTLCAKTMIPSLFPFMVAAELIVGSGMGRRFAHPLSHLLKRVFGVSETASCALVLGVLCGFPVGARTAASYYRNGEMDVRELNHVLSFCNLPSSAFLIGAVGQGLFGNARVGQVMLVLTLTAAAAIGLIFRFLLPRRMTVKRERQCAMPQSDAAHGSLLSGAIASAAGGMLSVCATVLLFSALIGTLEPYAMALGLSETVRAVLFGLIELSTGTAKAGMLPQADTAAALCAAMAGWAGLSVHCQILAVCDGCPVALGWFWLSRALQGAMCGVGMWLLLRTGLLDSVRETHGVIVDVWARGSIWMQLWQAVCMIGFFAATALFLIGKQKRRRST